MKCKILLFIFVCFFCSSQIFYLKSANHKKTLQIKKSKPKIKSSNISSTEDKEIFSTLIILITNFGKLLLNPKDPDNIKSSLGAMIAGMFNFLKIITKRNSNIDQKEIITFYQDIQKFLDKFDEKTKEEIIRIANEKQYSI